MKSLFIAVICIAVFMPVMTFAATKVNDITIKGYKYAKPNRSISYSAKIKPTNAKNKKVKWSSSNKSVAKVTSNGIVKTIKPGTATITAKAADGSGVKSTRKITVYQLKKNDMKWVAHRGLHKKYTENTASAFSAAGESGFWGCECDIMETKHTDDGFEIVINHDDSFKRVFGVNRKVKDMTVDDIMRNSKLSEVCFFGEYLDICKAYNMVPVIELKDKNMSDEAIYRTVDMVYELDGGKTLKKAKLISFHLDVVDKANQYAKSTYNITPITAYIAGDKNTDKQLMNKCKDAYNRGLSGMSFSKNAINQNLCDYCKSRGMILSFWSFNDSNSDEDMLYKHLKNYKPNTVTVDAVVFV